MKHKPCANSTPAWFIGHWRDWHRGHGCDRDDGKSRSTDAATEIAQHEANKATGFLTDAELAFLRTSTTSGNTVLVRALDELAARRVTARRQAEGALDHATVARLGALQATSDHSARRSKYFSPVLGVFCVCEHCSQLPEHVLSEETT